MGTSIEDLVFRNRWRDQGQRRVQGPYRWAGRRAVCIPEYLRETPGRLRTHSAKPARSWVSGGMVVLDGSSCMVDMARFLSRLHSEGVVWQVHLLPYRHQADAGDAGADHHRRGAVRRTSKRLQRLAPSDQTGPSLCGLGQNRSEPRAHHHQVLRETSTPAHIDDHKCPAASLLGAGLRSSSTRTSATGARSVCGTCPVDAISGGTRSSRTRSIRRSASSVVSVLPPANRSAHLQGLGS